MRDFIVTVGLETCVETVAGELMGRDAEDRCDVPLDVAVCDEQVLKGFDEVIVIGSCGMTSFRFQRVHEDKVINDTQCTGIVDSSSRNFASRSERRNLALFGWSMYSVP